VKPLVRFVQTCSSGYALNWLLSNGESMLCAARQPLFVDDSTSRPLVTTASSLMTGDGSQQPDGDSGRG